MLRVAVVGAGWAGTRHVQAIRELCPEPADAAISVEALVDNDADFLASQAGKLGVGKRYTDYREALADPDIDAVSICAPHALHCSIALDAAAAGKHILCEKPMALTVEDAGRMIEAAQAAGVRLYVAENVCYTPMSRFLRDIAQTGKHVGELTFATCAAGFRAQRYGYPGRRRWLAEPDLGGTGTWMLHGIHTMAQLRFILGEVETVYMRRHTGGSFEPADLEGTMSGLLTMASGIQVHVTQTAETRLPGNLRGYALHGNRGSVRASDDGCEVFGDTGEAERLRYPESRLSDYALEMQAFAEYVAGASEGPTTGASERRSLAVVQAGYESAASGRPVHLRERFGDL